MTLIMTPSLRNALYLDAAGSTPIGLAFAVAPGTFAGLFALPQPLLIAVAVFIVGWVALLVAAARRPAIPRSFGWTFVVGNVVWMAASFALLLSGLVQPNLFGTLFVIAQALAVGLFALLQWLAIRAPSAVAAR
ncbi:hypothetical protein [Aquibium microcysteis]|uniref:hypothetical protein n=1 Tax=Aquibium microcysteis TaxID=675281 RepID=UPI00165D2329|nr:hypothetical protein [Aquibium microcysteis]